jgi:hypothetical protein
MQRRCRSYCGIKAVHNCFRNAIDAYGDAFDQVFRNTLRIRGSRERRHSQAASRSPRNGDPHFGWILRANVVKDHGR